MSDVIELLGEIEDDFGLVGFERVGDYREIVRDSDWNEGMTERLDGLFDVVLGFPQHPFLAAELRQVPGRQQSLVYEQNDRQLFL